MEHALARESCSKNMFLAQMSFMVTENHRVIFLECFCLWGFIIIVSNNMFNRVQPPTEINFFLNLIVELFYVFKVVSQIINL